MDSWDWSPHCGVANCSVLCCDKYGPISSGSYKSISTDILIYLLIFQHILTAGGCRPSRSEYDPSVPSPHCGTCLHLSVVRSVFALPWLIIQLIFLKTEAQRQSWHHKMNVRASVCLSESAQLELRYSQQWAFIDDGRSDLVELEADSGSYFNKERI